ncbi:MAG: glycoside hydrolase family 2 protein [Bacilli bacterium]
MRKTLLLNGEWTLSNQKQQIVSQVPGDITIDFYNAKLISNPYVGENYKDAEWIGHHDYIYTKEFVINKEEFEAESVNLVFKGIDLFADIYINDHFLGSTKNAFLLYKYQIKTFLKLGRNVVKVIMRSTLKAMEQIDTTGYFAIFNLPRMFIRKPQCHFGWDWAPKICAYGIIDDVLIEFKNKHQIVDIQVVADNRGNLKLFTEINYDIKDLLDPNLELLKKGEEAKNDKLVYYISQTPNGNDFSKFEIPVTGMKNYFVKKFDQVELWWPVGYGKPSLYNYRVELVRDGVVKDCKEGKIGFRSVEIREDPVADNMISMDFYINGKKIYLKGSNWVPPECFSGVMQDDKYRKLISLAQKMNANILRIWGGGAYEKDIFYDLCDEAGILVWQDFAFACADIPDDNKEFVDNFMDEATYQIKRLRNHPSLIYWCGGNEKTGSYGNCITHGDHLVNVALYGLVQALDGTRPYRRQSPYSYSDIGNDPHSGDSHHNHYELALERGLGDYRKHVASQIVPFISECAVLGPSSVETLKKIFPEDKLWPINEMWLDRFMDNPYAAIRMEFPQREVYYAEQLFDRVDGLEDFVQKSMIAHAEALRAECEFSRAHKEITGAFLNWMFNDIWPSGTWAVVDYFLEPKEAYYQLKKSYAPLLVSFFEDYHGKTNFFVDNQTMQNFVSDVAIYVKNYEGEILHAESIKVDVTPEIVFRKVIDYSDYQNDIYFAAEYMEHGEKKNVIYSPKMFAYSRFGEAFDAQVSSISQHEIKVVIKAKSFIKSLFLHFPDNFKYVYSDNYLTLEKGATKTVFIHADEEIDIDGLQFKVFRGLNNE